MNINSRIYVAGHAGLVGSAIARRLQGYNNMVTRTHAELDLTNQVAVEQLFVKEKPEYVFLAAAKVGGIGANSAYPAEFIYSNMQVQMNVIDAAYKTDVKRLLFLGSSCIYPRHAPQPIREDFLLGGPLEETNEAYAVAKISGIKMCQAYNRQYGTDFVSVMPTNLYGPGDHYDAESSHVIPALIKKFHEAREVNAEGVTLWGTGRALREFLYVDDLAEACVLRMESKASLDVVNVGSGVELSIADLAERVRAVVGYKGRVSFDSSRPDGTPRKLLDSGHMRSLGWAPRWSIEDGLARTYEDFLTRVVKQGRNVCQ